MSGAEIALVLGASLVGAFVKAVTGMGYPLLAVPLATLAIGIDDAVVIVSVSNVTMNFLLCWQARDARHETRDLGVLVVTSLGGAVLGTWLLVSVPEEPLLVVLAATIGVYVVNAVRAPEFRWRPETATRFAPVVGTAAGVMQGAVGVSGPVVASWLHGYRLRPSAYVFGLTAVFGVSGATQLLILAAAGEFTAERSAVAAAAFVPALAMIPVGRRLRERLGGRGFERAVLAVLVVSGLALIVRVAGG